MEIGFVNPAPGRLPDTGTLGLREARRKLLDHITEEIPLEHFGRLDLALLNLLCAGELPGSENLHVPRCLERLDALAKSVHQATARGLPRFASDPDWGRSEPQWRMAMLVTVVKRDFGAAYSPTAWADLEAGVTAPFADSREIFLHGLLDDDPKRRWGTCASIPVLVAAVARRLRYPVGLAVTRTHVFARWENGVCFNIEASNPAGMTSPADEHYREELRGGLTAEERQSGFFVRTLYPAEEFGLFCKLRVDCLMDLARYEETLFWAARALQFSPNNPHLPQVAFYAADMAIKSRAWRAYPHRKLPACDAPDQPVFEVGKLLAIHELSPFMTIVAHHWERLGEMERAREAHEIACQYNYHGNNEQRDYQRFLRKHGLGRKPGPLLSPANLGRMRYWKIACRPEDEARLLRAMADRCERNGELLRARDALRDLYLFDPADAEVFQRARAIEKHPRFQEQLKAKLPERQRAIQRGEVLWRG